jgi:hypothetical protein
MHVSYDNGDEKKSSSLSLVICVFIFQTRPLLLLLLTFAKGANTLGTS